MSSAHEHQRSPSYNEHDGAVVITTDFISRFKQAASRITALAPMLALLAACNTSGAEINIDARGG